VTLRLHPQRVELIFPPLETCANPDQPVDIHLLREGDILDIDTTSTAACR
jgi:hypothetical protein